MKYSHILQEKVQIMCKSKVQKINENRWPRSW